jgi:DNA polymerase-3 subunit epsilon
MAEIQIGILDTETTGLSTKNGHRICDVGAVILRFRGTKLVSIDRKFQTFINPGFHIPPIVSAIHHITDRIVENAPTYDSLPPEFINFMEELSDVNFLGTYNLQFDWSFLIGLYPKLEEYPDTRRVCFLRTIQKYYPRELNHQLQYLRYKLEIEPIIENWFTEPIQAHRAFSDVAVTTALLVKALEDNKDKVKTWGEFFDCSSMTPNSIMFFGTHKGKTLLEIYKNEKKYVGWLFNQDWFESKYTAIHNVLRKLVNDEKTQPPNCSSNTTPAL